MGVVALPDFFMKYEAQFFLAKSIRMWYSNCRALPQTRIEDEKIIFQFKPNFITTISKRFEYEKRIKKIPNIKKTIGSIP